MSERYIDEKIKLVIHKRDKRRTNYKMYIYLFFKLICTYNIL